MNLSGNDVLMVVGLTALVAASVWFILAWRSPAVFLGFFLWIHIEDLVRIMLGNLRLVFFVKGVLLAALLLGYAHRQWRLRRSLWEGFPAFVPLCVLFGLAVVQAFNPAIQHPLQPVIGLHAQFLYIPMFLVAYQYFDSEERIRQFLLFTFTLTALESLLTLPQMIFGPSWWYAIVGKPDTLEMFVGRAGARAGEDFFRPSSIFANAGRFYQYLSVVATIMVGGLFHFQQKRDRLLAYGCFFSLCVGVFITSGRTTVYLLVAAIALFLLVRMSRLGARVRVTFAVAGAACAMLWIVPPMLGKQAEFIQNLLVAPVSSFDPSAGNDNLFGRLMRYGTALQRATSEAGWTGHGLGSNSLGLYFIGLQTTGEEPGYAALVWEYGIAGLVLWLALMGTVWVRSLRAYRRLRGTPYQALGLAVVALVSFAFIYQYIGYQILQNYLVTIYFWTFAAMLFALQRLAEQEHEEFSDETGAA